MLLTEKIKSLSNYFLKNNQKKSTNSHSRGIHNAYHGPLFRSDLERYPWIQLDFGRKSAIIAEEVIVTNNFDGYGIRLRDATVQVGDVPLQANQSAIVNPICGTYKGPSYNGDVVIVQCLQPLAGQFVSLQLSSHRIKTVLHINEIVVCGHWN